MTILAGLVADAAVHAGLTGGPDAIGAGVAAGGHVAHLAVFMGMVLVLAGVTADGVGTRSRGVRQEGVHRDAVR